VCRRAYGTSTTWSRQRADPYHQIPGIQPGVTEYMHPIYDIDMAARLGQVSAALIVNSGPQRHVVVHLVIQATSVDETGLETPVSPRNELKSFETGLGGRDRLHFGTVRPRVQIPGPRAPDHLLVSDHP
jgi:hypothetical protein